jgi:hypothetical protein
VCPLAPVSTTPPVTITVPLLRIDKPEQKISRDTGYATLVTLPVTGSSTTAWEFSCLAAG